MDFLKGKQQVTFSNNKTMFFFFFENQHEYTHLGANYEIISDNRVSACGLALRFFLHFNEITTKLIRNAFLCILYYKQYKKRNQVSF